MNQATTPIWPYLVLFVGTPLILVLVTAALRRLGRNATPSPSSAAASAQHTEPFLTQKAFEIAGFAAGLVGLAMTGILIPDRISADSNTRLDRATCHNSVLLLRRNLNQLNTNYTVAPQQDDQRMADWDSLKTEIENTRFGCQRVPLTPPDDLAALADILKTFDAAKDHSQHFAPDHAYLNRVSAWSASALQSLT